jgi:hypothetical protein
MSNEVQEFVAACIRKGEAEEEGNSDRGNKQYTVIHRNYLLLRDNNQLCKLLPLLSHENPYVRLWSSAYTLQLAQKEAEHTLDVLSQLDGNVGFCAMITLREWKASRLIL